MHLHCGGCHPLSLPRRAPRTPLPSVAVGGSCHAQPSLLGPERHRNVKQGSSSKEMGADSEAALRVENNVKSPGRDALRPTAAPAGVLGGNPGKADPALPSVLFPGPATLGPDAQPTPLKGREFVCTPPSLGPTMGPRMSPRSPWAWVFAPQAPPNSAPTIINGQHPPQTRCQHRRLFRKRKKGSAAGCVRGNLGSWDGGGWRRMGLVGTRLG